MSRYQRTTRPARGPGQTTRNPAGAARGADAPAGPVEDQRSGGSEVLPQRRASDDHRGRRPLSQDFRRGSVGATANRETNAARDFSEGIYFRRARFGIEGNIARDFNYRLLLELGGAGTEGPTRINDAWIAYTGLAPFTLQLGAFSPPANMDDGTTPEDLPFIERASVSELSRTLGPARMGESASACKPMALAG